MIGSLKVKLAEIALDSNTTFPDIMVPKYDNSLHEKGTNLIRPDKHTNSFKCSGRVLDSRPRGCRFEPHCVVSLSKNINPSLVLVQPRKTHPYITERLLMGRTESNQTKIKQMHTEFIMGCLHYTNVGSDKQTV